MPQREIITGTGLMRWQVYRYTYIYIDQCLNHSLHVSLCVNILLFMNIDMKYIFSIWIFKLTIKCMLNNSNFLSRYRSHKPFPSVLHDGISCRDTKFYTYASCTIITHVKKKMSPPPFSSAILNKVVFIEPSVSANICASDFVYSFKTKHYLISLFICTYIIWDIHNIAEIV